MPISQQFDDIYFNPEAGVAESRYVFITQNGLPQRWENHSSASKSPQTHFRIAETGFGTGLNFLTLWQQLRESASAPLHLHFISFEKYPLSHADLARALRPFPEFATLTAALLEQYPIAEPGCHRMHFQDPIAQGGHRITLDLWLGDIQDTLPEWRVGAENQVDAWFLDGFAPSKNPDMWQPSLYQAMASTLVPGGTFATFTAASDVRRGLEAAGLQVEKIKGFGRKRNMLRGQRPRSEQGQSNARQSAPAAEPHLIIGGGIAAACLTLSLARRGIAVTVISPAVADAASGNPQAACYPLLQAEHSPTSQFYSQAFCYAQQLYQRDFAAYSHWHGVSQLAINADRERRYQKISTGLYAEDLVAPMQTHPLSATEALPGNGLYYPAGGWVEPQGLVHALFAEAQRLSTVTRISAEVNRIEAVADSAAWSIHTTTGASYQATQVTVAAGIDTQNLLATHAPERAPAIQPVRGQVTQIATQPALESLRQVLCAKGYFTPALNEQHCIGATFGRQQRERDIRAADDQENLENFATLLGQLMSADQVAQVLANTSITGQRAAVRATTKDHLPIVGEVATGLSVLGGLGSRGFTSAPLCAEVLAAQCYSEPLPMSADLAHRLRPARLFATP